MMDGKKSRPENPEVAGAKPLNPWLLLPFPLVLGLLAWLNWSGFHAEQLRRSRLEDRLLITAYETVAGADEKTTETHITVRNTSATDLHRVSLEMTCQAPGMGRTTWPHEFVTAIPSGATVRLPAWELGVSLGVGTSFDCRVTAAR
ncbi:MAG: hypothetical protein JWO82_861 [Akkermansiaceae bacterium]|nr:hypothetical protein [Akkermansiaceae bacterium]